MNSTYLYKICKFILQSDSRVQGASNRQLNKKSFFIQKRISRNIRYRDIRYFHIIKSKYISNNKIPRKHRSRTEVNTRAINIIENENRSCPPTRGTVLRNEDSPLLPYPRQFCQFPWIRSRYAKPESLRKH